MEMSRLDPEKSTSKSLASREREGDPSEGRSDAESSTSTLYDTMEPDDKGRSADVEKDAGQKPNGQSAGRVSRTTLTVWMVVNTLATIGIVCLGLIRWNVSTALDNRLTTTKPSVRSLPTKPFSTTPPSNNVKPPSLPFISSSPF